MEKVRPKDGKRQSMSAGLLPLYNGHGLSRSQTSMYIGHPSFVFNNIRLHI